MSGHAAPPQGEARSAPPGSETGRPTARSSASYFLFCFICLVGGWQLHHGVLTVEHADLDFAFGRHPVPEGVASVGQDFAWAWNGAANLVHNEINTRSGGGLYSQQKIYGPSPLVRRYNHPPLVAFLYRPFVRFDVTTAYRIYALLIMMLWVLSFLMLGSLFAFRLEHYALGAGMLMFSAPFLYELERGNQHSPTVFLCIASFYLLVRRRDRITAGFVATLAVLFKLYPLVLLIYLILKGQRRLALIALLSGCVVVACSGGMELYTVYFSWVGRWSDDIAKAVVTNHSTYSALLLTFKDALTPHTANLLAFGLGAVLYGAVLLYFLSAKVRRSRVLLGLELGCVLIIGNVSYKTGTLYNLVFLPAAIFPLLAALDHPALRQRLAGAWSAVVIAASLLGSALFLAPFNVKGTAPGSFYFGIQTRAFELPWVLLFQKWLLLMCLLAAMLVLHRLIHRAEGGRLERPWRGLLDERIGDEDEAPGWDGAVYPSRFEAILVRGAAAAVLLYALLNPIT